MKKTLVIIGICGIIILSTILVVFGFRHTTTMNITSSAFQANQPIPQQYTCMGADINPPLQFFDVPEQAKSLVLLVDDPDAPNGTWVHWVVFNLDPKTTGVAENTPFASGTEGITSFGKTGYGGPCPPSGTHRYFFKLFALDTVLSLQGNADAALVNSVMQGHIIEKATLMGTVSK